MKPLIHFTSPQSAEEAEAVGSDMALSQEKIVENMPNGGTKTRYLDSRLSL